MIIYCVVETKWKKKCIRKYSSNLSWKKDSTKFTEFTSQVRNKCLRRSFAFIFTWQETRRDLRNSVLWKDSVYMKSIKKNNIQEVTDIYSTRYVLGIASDFKQLFLCFHRLQLSRNEWIVRAHVQSEQQ